ncbi:MAG: hypothetical protein RIT26_1748 [Pseudomonadota bacterium]
MAAAPMRQPCPACATGEFLEMAWKRAQRVNASCECFNCMPKSGLGTAGFKIALEEAMRVNPSMARRWLSEREAMAS